MKAQDTLCIDRLARYVGRLAPSPTGLLHLGHVATFAVAHARARAAGGVLWLRDDDLDSDRVRPEFAAAMRDDLRWLGLAWDAEARQSERLPLYREALDKLLATGAVYACTCSRRDLQQAAAAPHEVAHGAMDEPVYNGRCRPAQTGVAITFAAGTSYRFRVQDGERVVFQDKLAGTQSFTAGSRGDADFGDFLVWRRGTAACADGLPSYQLASVVDDIAMGITEVVRGRDLLRSTARQLLLWQALTTLPPPAFAHTPLLRDAAGVRLAKRHDALSVRTLRAAGSSAAQVLAMAQQQLAISRA